MPVLTPQQRQRRGVLACGAALGCAVAAVPVRAAPIGLDALLADAAALQNALGTLPQAGAAVTLDLQDHVENGALVPVGVSSLLPGTRRIAIVVASNPVPLAACFTLPDGTEPTVSMRIRMAGTGRVHALVECDAGLYAASRDCSVGAGGCG